MTKTVSEQPKQVKRISPDLAEVLHMLKAIEAQSAGSAAMAAR
jgi:hypothetical protein